MREGDVPVVGIVFLLAVIVLELYLIYAIIATRQDVRVIRRLLQSPSKSPVPLPPSESVDLTKHAGLRVTAYSDDWAIGESLDGKGWVLVNQRSGVRETFVSVEQAESEFETRTDGEYLHVKLGPESPPAPPPPPL
jgi:hypothetical protein